MIGSVSLPGVLTAMPSARVASAGREWARRAGCIASTGKSAASTPMTSALRPEAATAVAMPEISPPPPTGTITRVEGGQVLQNLQSDRALARDDGFVVEGMHEGQLLLPHDVFGEGAGSR